LPNTKHVIQSTFSKHFADSY